MERAPGCSGGGRHWRGPSPLRPDRGLMSDGDPDAGSTGIHLEAQDQAALVRVGNGYRTRPLAPVSVRWPVGPVAAAFVVSRVVAVAGLLIGGSVDEGRLSTAGLTSWDGQWYLMIARRGYGLPPVARPG